MLLLWKVRSVQGRKGMRLPLSIRVLLLLVLPGLAALPGAANGAFRCGASVGDGGDWPVEVEERCGAPDYGATDPTATVPGIGVVGEVEHWYYNPGRTKSNNTLIDNGNRIPFLP
jgi:hypothetical protein